MDCAIGKVRVVSKPGRDRDALVTILAIIAFLRFYESFKHGWTS